MSDEVGVAGVELGASTGHSPGLQVLHHENSENLWSRNNGIETSQELISRDTEQGRIEFRALFQQTGQSLVTRRYAARGYRVSRGADVTLGAYWNGQLASTMGLRRDGGGTGGLLTADQSFPEEMAAMRAQGVKLCEFTRLAGEPQGPSKLMLASLFHLAYLHACHLWGAEVLVIEVNPRHQSFYRRMLGFQPHGEQRLHRGVGAPAVLMSLSLAFGSQEVRRHGGSMDESDRARTLYPYFFAPDAEPLLLSRLADVYGRD